ncbi:MAG: head GIN domain-containing protein, partial [bacterium]
MKKIVLTLAALSMFSLSHAQWWGKGKKGNGNVTTETREVGDYDEIKCGGSMDFILVAGDEGTIKIEGESNLLEYIVTEVKGDKLVVKVENGVNLKPSWNKGIKITIPFRDVSAVSLAGSGDLYTKDTIKANDFDVSLAGSGDVIVDVEATSVEASIAGSGDLTVKGNTNNLEAKVAGSGDFHGFDLES